MPSLLGGNKFVEWAKSKFLEGNVQKDLPQSKILAPDGPIIINAVCGFYKAEEKDIIAVRRGLQNEPRNIMTPPCYAGWPADSFISQIG